MAGILAVVALACAAAACAAVIRTQLAVHRLAKALAREWGLSTGGGPATRTAQDVDLEEREEWLRRSVEALEHRMREMLARAAGLEPRTAAAAPATGVPAAPAGPRAPSERVREHLIALGYEEVAVLPPRTAGGALLVEARREGMPSKGSARVTSDGRVEVQWGARLRIFP